MLAPSFRYNAGIVRFFGTQFFTGDGSTSSAGLVDRHGNAISSSLLKTVSAIHRTDWQGRQLLYPTARTNSCLQSQALNASPWSTNSTSVTAAGEDYAGTIPYWEIAKTTSGAAASLYQIFSTVAVNTVLTATVALRATSTSSKVSIGLYGSTSLWGNSDGSTANCSVLSGPGSVAVSSPVALFNVTGLSTSIDTLIQITRTYKTSETSRIIIYPDENTSVTSGAAILATRVMLTEQAAPQGSYLATTTAAVSVTDYTLGGSTVAFGESPADGAVCDWTGVAIR